MDYSNLSLYLFYLLCNGLWMGVGSKKFNKGNPILCISKCHDTLMEKGIGDVWMIEKWQGCYDDGWQGDIECL